MSGQYSNLILSEASDNVSGLCLAKRPNSPAVRGSGVVDGHREMVEADR